MKINKWSIGVSLLFSFSIPNVSHAVKWVLVGQSTSVVDDNYIDADSIKDHPQIPNIKRAWTLSNYASPQYSGAITYSSTKTRYEFDCYNDTARIISFVGYSQINGLGNIATNQNTAGQWSSTIPGSLGEAYLIAACQLKYDTSLVPRVTANNILGQTNQPPIAVSPEFTKAYNQALIAMGDKASSLKADQQQWWKNREKTCRAIPDYLYQTCMNKEEKERIKFLTTMTKAFKDNNI